MQEQFHSSSKLKKSHLIDLMQRSNNPAIVRFVMMMALFFVTSSMAVYFWNGAFWQLVLTQILFGILCCSTFACLHETAHGTAFRSRLFNRYAALICGILHVYPSVAFKELHFTHHRYTHIPGKDPEISFGNHPLPSVIAALPSYLGWLTGVPLLLFKIVMTLVGALGMPEPIRKRIYPFIRPKVRGKLFIESWLLLAIYAAVIYLATYVNNGYWALIVGQVVGHSFLASYLTAEHNGLPHEGNILEKTRSMRAANWVKLLMWNMTYHAEHHAYPAVPFHALPDLHNAMQGELQNSELNHPQFHKSVLKNLF